MIHKPKGRRYYMVKFSSADGPRRIPRRRKEGRGESL